MEADWGRPDDFIRLALSSINDMIEPSGYVASAAELITEGHANTNYRLTIAANEFVHLRLYQRDSKVAALERAVLRSIDLSLPVPRPLWFSDQRRCAVFTWCEGRSIEQLVAKGEHNAVEEAAESIGKALGKLSSVRFPHAGFLDEQLTVCSAWPSTAEGLFDYMDSLLGSTIVRGRAGEVLATRLERVSRTGRRRLGEVGAQPNLTHGDFKASNLLINEGQLSGVLDWEFVHSGTWLLDAGQLFRHPLPKKFRMGFERGFASAGGELTHGWRELARAIDALSLVDFLSRPASSERRISEVRKLAMESCEALESWV